MRVKGGVKTSGADLQHFLNGAWQPIAEHILEVAARKVEAKAKLGAPYLTGALKNSMHVEKPRALRREVKDGVMYGVFQELGTSRIGARGFLTAAAESEADDFFNAVLGIFS